MIISIFGSIIIFITLSLAVGSIWDKGYDLNKLNTLADDIIASIRQKGTGREQEIKPILDSLHTEHTAIHFAWIQADGTKIYDTSGDLEDYNFSKLADRFINMPSNFWAEDENISLIYSITLDQQRYYLLMSLPSESMKQGQIYFFIRTTKVLMTLLLPLLAAFIVPYLLAILFFSWMNRRISKLNNALAQVNLQSNSIVLEDETKDEIGQLTQHYNSMVQRIQSQVVEIEQFENRRKQLLSNLSHDLRTPLTMILGYAETIRNGLYKGERELQASAKIILQRSRYMDRLLDQLLDITKQNTNALTLQLASHNLSEILRKIIADYLLFIDGQDYDVDIDIADADIVMWIDAALIERAIRNLIDNAIRYGKEGRYLGVVLVEHQNEVWITIKDKGQGIALEEQQRVFERFYRSNQGRHGEGLGIGLSIVQEIVALHQGNIRLSSTPYVETIFQIQLFKRNCSP